MNQDKHCSECNKFYKTSELLEKLFCPTCEVFTDHVWEFDLSDYSKDSENE